MKLFMQRIWRSTMKTIITLATLLMSQLAMADGGSGGVPHGIPEPSVIALFAIGGIAMFLGRRRNK
jgi:hypothetical protein